MIMSAHRAYKKTIKSKKVKVKDFFRTHILPTINEGLYSYTTSAYCFSDELALYFRKKGYIVTYDSEGHYYTISWGKVNNI